MNSIKININGKEIELPIVEGTENENGIDITQLRKETGYITLDPGYANTGACISNITFIDGEKGILRYRGYPIEQLAGKVSFTDTAFLLLNGEFPNIDEKEKVQVMLVAISVAHFIQNQELKSRLEDINSSENNLKIREAARIALGKFII